MLSLHDLIKFDEDGEPVLAFPPEETARHLVDISIGLSQATTLLEVALLNDPDSLPVTQEPHPRQGKPMIGPEEVNLEFVIEQPK